MLNLVLNLVHPVIIESSESNQVTKLNKRGETLSDAIKVANHQTMVLDADKYTLSVQVQINIEDKFGNFSCSLAFKQNKKKSDGLFDQTMGSFDGTKKC